MRYRDWTDSNFSFEADYLHTLYSAEMERRIVVWKVQHDLAEAAAGLGQTYAQIGDKMDTLFSTFASEWSIYILTGATAIVTAIQNDATIGWLDTDVSGTSIRQRLINRLS